MTSYVEFLTENAQRRYPFVEDCSLADINATQVLSDGVVLDVRGFHRARPEIKPQLLAVIGSTGFSIFGADAIPGQTTFYFVMGQEDFPLVFAVPVPNGNTVWPYTFEYSIQDPHYPNQEVLSGTLRVTFGEAAGALPADTSIGFNYSAQLEPSLVAELYRNQVDYLKVVHESGPSEFVGGDVVLKAGYNMEVLQGSQGLRLNAVLGGGLGRFTGSINDAADSACRGFVTAINGAIPDEKGEFTIKGERGIRVESYPAEHKIRIRISPETLTGDRCS